VRPGTAVDPAESDWLRAAFEAVRQSADSREEAAR